MNRNGAEMTFQDIISPNGWHPVIGDPYAAAWIITFAYFAVAFLCFRAAAIKMYNVSDDQKVHRIFWMGTGVFLLLLGINKQLDMQSWFFLLGRAISLEQGWYGQRRIVQAVFSLALLMCGVSAGIFLLVVLKGRWGRFRTPLLGLALLVVFVILRASSFSHIYYFPNVARTVGPVKTRWIIELGGILVVGAGALRGTRRYARRE
jgi:hypothetical protein